MGSTTAGSGPAAAFGGISPHFRPSRHRLTAPEWRIEMADRFTVWREVTATVVA
jgi:putative transposase